MDELQENNNGDQEYKSSLYNIYQSNYEQFDKAILTLSSGGLGLSLTFIKNTSNQYAILNYNMLEYSWYCFTASIISTIVSFLIGANAIKKALKGHENHDYKKSTKVNWTEILNYFSVLSFLIAVILTICFVSKTMEKDMMNKKETLKKNPPMPKGIPPPPPPDQKKPPSSPPSSPIKK